MAESRRKTTNSKPQTSKRLILVSLLYATPSTTSQLLQRSKLLPVNSTFSSSHPCYNQQAQNSCAKCIQTHPHCAWSEVTLGKKRQWQCFNEIDGSSEKFVNSETISPKSTIKTINLKKAAKNKNQYIFPEAIELNIRPGDTIEFDVEFKVHETYPVDIYFLTDLSGSMKEYIETVEKQSNNIITNMKKVMGRDVKLRMGAGSFIEKPTTPFTNIGGHHVFKNWMPLSDMNDLSNSRKLRNIFQEYTRTKARKSSSGKEEFKHLKTNADNEEAGLEALIQVAACTDEINWDPKSRHIVVYSSDATAHMAGDGMFAGINTPNDLKCHLQKNGGGSKSSIEIHEYTAALDQDYPAARDVKKVLQENNIQMIFATTDHEGKTEGKVIEKFYRDLAQFLGRNENKVGLWDKDDPQIISKIIVDAYTEMTKDIPIEINKLPEGFEYTVTPVCGGNRRRGSIKSCPNMRKKNSPVKFNFRVKMREGGECPKPTIAVIKTPGYGGDEHTAVQINPICSCKDCNIKSSDICPGKQECSGNGQFECGKCVCDVGFKGECCDCDMETSSTDGCIEPGSQRVCSGRGECICGKCSCNDGVNFDMGQFCECDRSACPIFNNTICGGNGHCTCSSSSGVMCDCNPGWTGDRCRCTTETDLCESDDFGELCSNKGECKCNSCECLSSLSGELTEDEQEDAVWLFTPESKCSSLKINCDLMEECIKGECPSSARATWNQTETNNLQIFETFCDYPDPSCKCDGTNQCSYTQLAFWVEHGKLNYHKRSEAFCSNVNILAVTFWTLVSTLMLGLLVIIAMKVIVVYLDNKEQKQFRVDTQKTLKGDGNTIRRQTSFRSSVPNTPSTPLMKDVGFSLKS